MISTVSGGRLTISSDDLTYYLAPAIEDLLVDNPGLGPANYDRALALLVCHYYAADSQGDLEMKSEDRGGDWKYSKDAGMTSYLVQYQALIARHGKPSDVPVDGTVREDASMTGANLDLNTLPTFTETEDEWAL